MINYSRESYFKDVVTKMSIHEQRRTFSACSNDSFDIFLSYNINDKDVVKGIYYVLKGMGFKVYLDFMIDPQMDRGKVTKETATCIQSRLKHSKCLIYAQSSNATMSKWMPWELGVVDGNTSKCFIMPVQKVGETIYSRQEYLLLYPIIGINNINQLLVYTSEYSNYGIPLKDCL